VAAAGGIAAILTPLAVTLAKVAAFVGVMLVGGRRLIPWALHRVAGSGSRELFTLAVLAVSLGIAYGAAAIFGVSFALGAFFAGMVLAESELSHRAAEDSLPLRDAFAVLFFVSVGMLFDPGILVRMPLAVLATFAVIVLGKSVAAFAIVRLFGYSRSTALTVSVSLAQIGEFSFILAALGVSLGLLLPEAQDLILAGAILSIVVNPLLFTALDRLRPRLAAPASALPELRQPCRPEPLEIRAGVIARPGQRRRRDHQEPLAEGRLLVAGELLRRDEPRHPVVLRRRLQVLPDCQEIDVRGAQVVHHLPDRLPLLAEPDHDPRLGEHRRVKLLDSLENPQAVKVARPRPHLRV
jgi:hypothetical protein